MAGKIKGLTLEIGGDTTALTAFNQRFPLPGGVDISRYYGSPGIVTGFLIPGKLRELPGL